ncbi:MAG TPA: penicillin-binding transpeptidase domain-containing protein, partial [Candidatus Krumholzibacteria bacterium]
MVAQTRDSGLLRHGQTALLDGQADAARESFERLLWSPTRWREARTGLSLVHALDGTATTSEVPIAAQLDGFQLPLLLHEALTRGDFAGTARLAEFTPETLFPEAGLYHAAAQLERGDTSSARRLFASVAPALRSTALGRRIDLALDSDERGARTLVLDRNGTVAGHVDDLGRFELAPGVESAWLPEVVRPLVAQAQKQGVATLRLSTDLLLSRIARGALGHYRGTIVLVDITSGDVLVAVSDDATLRRIGTPAIEQFREPASIAKLITTTAALRHGIDPDSAIRAMDCRGALRYSSGTLWCPSSRGDMRGLDHALAISCNTTFARLGELIGRERLLAEFRRFGFDRGSLDLPGSGHILHPDGDSRQLADLSIGLEATDISPLHATLLAAVFGNGGAMPQPRFVTAYDGRLGLSPRPVAQLEQESV